MPRNLGAIAGDTRDTYGLNSASRVPATTTPNHSRISVSVGLILPPISPVLAQAMPSKGVISEAGPWALITPVLVTATIEEI